MQNLRPRASACALVPALAALAALAAGCASGGSGAEERLSRSTYRGATQDGREIVLDLHEEDGVLRGGGRVGDVPVTLAGTVQRSAVTFLVAGDGRGGPVRIDLHGAEAGVTLETWEGPVVLLPGTPAPPATGGPFAGRYRAVASGLVQADLEVEQSGAMLSGTGEVMGRPAALAGRALDDDRARASLILGDGSRLDVTLVRAADGSLALRGLGEDLELVRTGDAP